MLQTAGKNASILSITAYGEALAQNRGDQNRVVGLLETFAGKFEYRSIYK